MDLNDERASLRSVFNVCRLSDELGAKYVFLGNPCHEYHYPQSLPNSQGQTNEGKAMSHP